MEYYEVRHRFYDTVNRVQFQRGEIIQTDQDLWISRWGSSLKRIPSISKNTTIKIVEKTKEGSSAPKLEESVSKPVADKITPKRRGILNSVEDKMISADDSDVK